MNILRFTILSVLMSIVLVACGDQAADETIPFKRLPRLIGEHDITHGGVGISPARLQLVGDTLFVASSKLPRLDKYDSDLNMVGSIALTDPEPVYPTAFRVTDSTIIVADHARGLVVLYDREGKVVTSFGTLPDGSTALSPFALDYYGGVAYIGDAGLRRVLAVSVVDAEGVTAVGELILTIPADTAQSAGFPSAIMVTDDGRLLVGDALSGITRVFTCDGRFVYTFDSVATPLPMAPQGFAIDNVFDPSLQDSTSFDPSGVRLQGRIHIVDANNRQVHMFNALGKYVDSYPTPDPMGRPAGIAVDWKRQRIYVADPVAGKLYVYSYGSLD